MLPERHQWKPAVQAAAVMLRTPPVDGQSPASQPSPNDLFWGPVRCKTLTQSINPGFVCDLCSNYREARASQLVSGEEG